MKKLSKKQRTELKKEAADNELWEEVSAFRVSKPTSIRLPVDLISGLEMLARLHGERSYQTLLKKWVSERVRYELELVEVAKRKRR